MDCPHTHVVDPPPGKTLRICLDCAKRLIECSTCSAVTTAGPGINESGWMKAGVMGEPQVSYFCPDCWGGRHG